MAKEIVRKYSCTDEELLVRLMVIYNLLDGGDLAAFTVKFPWMDAAWLTAFLAAIDAAKDFPENEVVVGDIKELTANLQTSMDNGYRALDTLDVYARVAYEEDLVRQRIFGQDRWKAAKTDNEKMVEALEYAHGFANKAPYKAALMGKGMTQADIDQLETMAEEVDARNDLQEHAKGEQPATTQDRIITHNIAFGKMKTINTCADLVYRDNFAKLQQYKLYGPSGNDVNTTVDLLMLRLGAPLTDVEVEITNAPLAPQTTLANGIAHFESVNMPDTIEVKAIHPIQGQREATFPVITGQGNSFEIDF